MKRYGFFAVCLTVLLTCGCRSLEYGTLDGRVYTSGDRKVKITFPEGAAPQITAGYLENKYTCPDDFEAIYLDRATGSFLVCSAVIPPEQLKSADVKKLLQTPKGEASIFAATARIIQQKHRSTLNLLESKTDDQKESVFQIYSLMTDESGKRRVGSLFFQLKNRWFWLIYEPASENILLPAKAAEHIRQQLFRLKNAIQMP